MPTRFVGDVMPSNYELEVQEWLNTLDGDTAKRRDEIVDLLDHADEDGMTKEDREECLVGLKMLEVIDPTSYTEIEEAID